MINSKYFNMGQVVCTKNIALLMEENSKFRNEVLASINAFVNKDWGSLCDEDKKINNKGLANPEDLYLLGAYNTCQGKIYIITNRISENPGDNATTICFPDER